MTENEEWHYIETNVDGPASAEIGDVCLYVSRVADCLHARWVWTGDVPGDDPEDPRPVINGITRSRAEGMAEAEAAARRLHSGKLRIA